MYLFLACSTACSRGFYKSSSQDLQCSRCPAHSFNDREGSWRCDCEDGYYRALSDPPSVACTSTSAPRSFFHLAWELPRVSARAARQTSHRQRRHGCCSASCRSCLLMRRGAVLLFPVGKMTMTGHSGSIGPGSPCPPCPCLYRPGGH